MLKQIDVMKKHTDSYETETLFLLYTGILHNKLRSQLEKSFIAAENKKGIILLVRSEL